MWHDCPTSSVCKATKRLPDLYKCVYFTISTNSNVTVRRQLHSYVHGDIVTSDATPAWMIKTKHDSLKRRQVVRISLGYDGEVLHPDIHMDVSPSSTLLNLITRVC